MNDIHVVERHAHVLGHKLCEGRLLALPVGTGAGEHLHFAGGQHTHRRRLPESALEAHRASRLRGAESADLDVRRDADAHVAPLLALLELLLAQASVVDDLQRLVEGCLVVATIVHQRAGGGVGESVRRDEVLAPQVCRLDVQLACQQIHHALDQEGGLRATSTAVGGGRRGVGEDAKDIHRQIGDGIAAGDDQPEEPGGHARAGAARHVGAHVGVRLDAHRGNSAVAVCRQLCLVRLRAAVDRGDEVFAAVLDPLDGMTGPLGRDDRQDVAGVKVDLAAEAATDVARDHANLVLWDARDDRKDEARDVRILRRVPDRQLVGAWVPLRDGAARLHGVGDQPLLDEALLDDDLGIGEGSIDVAVVELPMIIEIAWHVVMQLRSTRLGCLHFVHHHRQRLVVRLDQMHGVARQCGVVRHDGSHSVAGVANAVGRHHRIRRHLQIGVGQQPDAGHRVDLAREVLAGDDRPHAGRDLGLGDIQPGDARMGVGAAHDGHVEHAGQLDVVGVKAAAGNEPGIFAPLDRRAEQFGDRHIGTLPPRSIRPRRRKTPALW